MATAVMPALVAGIHAYLALRPLEGVDGRHKAGHDELGPPHVLPCRMPNDSLAQKLADILSADADVMHVLTTVRALALPDWRLVAGGIYQTVWNTLTGRPRGHGIKDWDIAYFDDRDLSWEAEDAVIRRVTAAFGDWPVHVEVRNQARVHLWFKERFGAPYAPLRNTDESVGRYASVVHAVAVRLEHDGRLDILAPFGLDDLFALRIRPNRALPNAPSHDAKARRCKALWPEVTAELWDGTVLREEGEPALAASG